LSEHQVADDVQQGFRALLVVIAAIAILGIAFLIGTALVYRNTPGRHFPVVEATPSSVPGHTPSPR
jgi:hypothetical protein